MTHPAINNEPLFKGIFGTAWDVLPPVIRKHYANRANMRDHVTVEGTLDVLCAHPLLSCAPLLLLAGSIPPFNEQGVPVTVDFRTDGKTEKFHFHRTFHFQGRKPYIFRSYMLQIRDNVVVEIHNMIGWRMLYSWDGGKVVMRHNGYVLRLGRWIIPLPLHLLLGEGYAEETPIDDDSFSMRMHLTHPRWGIIYEYKGVFRVVQTA